MMQLKQDTGTESKSDRKEELIMLEIKINEKWQVAKSDNYNYRLQTLAFNEAKQENYWRDEAYYPTLKDALKAYITRYNQSDVHSVQEWINEVDRKLTEVESVVNQVNK